MHTCVRVCVRRSSIPYYFKCLEKYPLNNICKSPENQKASFYKINLSIPFSFIFSAKNITYPYIFICSDVRPSSVRPALQTSFPNRFANQSQVLSGNSMVMDNECLFAASGSLTHDQDGSHPNIWQKPIENLLLRNQWAVFHENWYMASGLGPIIVCSNNGHGSTLTYFKARSKEDVR